MNRCYKTDIYADFQYLNSIWFQPFKISPLIAYEYYLFKLQHVRLKQKMEDLEILVIVVY